jgi:hypothetical protein
LNGGFGWSELLAHETHNVNAAKTKQVTAKGGLGCHLLVRPLEVAVLFKRGRLVSLVLYGAGGEVWYLQKRAGLRRLEPSGSAAAALLPADRSRFQNSPSRDTRR